MILKYFNNIFLTYSLNLHPGEELEDVQYALFSSAPAVFQKVMPHSPAYAVGPWLNHRVAHEIIKNNILESLKQRLHDHNLITITLNGFPCSTFHGQRVKEQVYKPDWSSEERLDYTLLLVKILSELMPQKHWASISTVPVGYARLCSNEVIERSAENMAMCAWHLHKCAEQNGKQIVLSIEPEPDCVVEDLETFLQFYNDRLLCSGIKYLQRRYNLTPAVSERIVRRHVGMCLDSVHAAVCGDDMVECLQTLEGEGIRTGKIQLGAALRADGPDFTALEPFNDPVYLHQVRFFHDRTVTRFPDLAFFLESAGRLSPLGHALVHYHMPFTWKGSGPLTAYHNVTSDFIEKAMGFGVRCFELEIYTLSVFPELINITGTERDRLITDMIADELKWLIEKFDIIKNDTGGI